MLTEQIIVCQVALGRTSSGAEINPSLMPLMNNMQLNEVAECKNCHIVMLSDMFHSGCPNCGIKESPLTK